MRTAGFALDATLGSVQRPLITSEPIPLHGGDEFEGVLNNLGNQFNPGKIIDPPKMDESRLMRFPPGYKTIPLTPVLDWSAWNVQNDPVTEQTTAPGTGGDTTGGLAAAVEMCNNNGHCRKFDAGTMCPSYRVTRDEQHLDRAGPEHVPEHARGAEDATGLGLEGLEPRLHHREDRLGEDDRGRRAPAAAPRAHRLLYAAAEAMQDGSAG